MITAWEKTGIIVNCVLAGLTAVYVTLTALLTRRASEQLEEIRRQNSVVLAQAQAQGRQLAEQRALQLVRVAQLLYDPQALAAQADRDKAANYGPANSGASGELLASVRAFMVSHGAEIAALLGPDSPEYVTLRRVFEKEKRWLQSNSWYGSDDVLAGYGGTFEALFVSIRDKLYADANSILQRVLDPESPQYKLATQNAT